MTTVQGESCVALNSDDLAHLGDIPIRKTSIRDAFFEVVTATSTGKGQSFRLVNAYSIVCASQDIAYGSLLRNRGVNLPDGRPIVQALRLSAGGSTGLRQVRGPSFFAHCLDAGRDEALRHYFLGSDRSTLSALVREARRRFAGIEIAGFYSPPFRPLTEEERRAQDANILTSGANIVWVGLGTPKQDFEAQRICDELGIVAIGIGAAFDFLAGTKREAPRAMQRLGLEWLFRLATEPRRLWRRYLMGNVHFLNLVLREMIARRENSRRS